MKIPDFHDDQHCTAIISGAALINALELSQADREARIVFSGAGASALSCADHYVGWVRRSRTLLDVRTPRA